MTCLQYFNLCAITPILNRKGFSPSSQVHAAQSKESYMETELLDSMVILT